MSKVQPICKNCRLYDPGLGICRVVILHEGERINLPVDPDDHCFFEQKYFDPITGQEDTLNEVQHVRFWVEDENGKPTKGDGTVKIEYPEGFFGNLRVRDILGI